MLAEAIGFATGVATAGAAILMFLRYEIRRAMLCTEGPDDNRRPQIVSIAPGA